MPMDIITKEDRVSREVKIESWCRQKFTNLSEQERESQRSLKDCRRKVK